MAICTAAALSETKILGFSITVRLRRTELLWLISLLFVLWVVLIVVVISEARLEGRSLRIAHFSVFRLPASTIAVLLLFFAALLNLVSIHFGASLALSFI